MEWYYEVMERVPTDLWKALGVSPRIKEIWKGLTPIARRDFLSWIDGAKQPETRRRRVERVPDMLAKGKRRPCCYALVPMSLYKALAATPKAKVTWRGLRPDERRDFVTWIESAKQPELHKRRVEKVCGMLASGKRHP